MTKLLYLDYISLLIYILTILTLILRSNKSEKNHSLFGLLIGLSTITTIYDIAAVSLDNYGSGAVPLRYILHIGYLVLRNLVTPFFAIYIVSLTDTWHLIKKKGLIKHLFFLPFGIVAILTLSSPFTKLIFSIDKSCRYVRGPLFFLLYISAVFYTFFCIYYAVKYYNVLKPSRFYPLITIAPNQVVAVVIQLLYPSVLCEMFANAMCLLFLMLTVERPAGKNDSSTGFLRPHSFTEYIIQATAVKKPLSIILINVTNFSSLNSYLSVSDMDEIYRSLQRRIVAIEKHHNVEGELYHLENGLFSVILSDEYSKLSTRYAKDLLSTLNHSITTKKSNISLTANVCVIRVPDDIENIDYFNLIAREFRKMKYSGEIVMLSNISKGNDFSVIVNMDKILSESIANNRFEVYYQPIYSVKEKRINSAEALIRLKTEKYGFIRPDLFIPMAEESGAIHEIGMIVFEEVCKFIASNDFKRLNVDYIEVNLSVVQCMEKDLDIKLLNMMKKYGVRPSQINLELTETASELTQTNLMSNINLLHTSGISFSLDDFGTGYSNMVRISSLPLHIVKLDKSFTWTKNNPELQLALEKTVNMIKKMDMHIVVEGIEDKDMLTYFENLDCDYIQGYYFSKPLPKDDFVSYVENTKFN